eukprot:TRINITY_DN3481_c0_g1_i5.p1 TRINITY_DN3481_c0_g1~~TRINITY_DN3481_c0_g1_i5.p1  ORF type:complete len:802 (+),score=217.02 TRINITY_DN3481_c0_g1_i5:325-2406(+)
MSRGGFTLLVTSVTCCGAWTTSVVSRNIYSPALRVDYSTLTNANTMKQAYPSGSTNTFLYILEAGNRYRNGGIFSAAGWQSFVSTSPGNTQIGLVQVWDSWVFSEWGIEKRMPWLGASPYLLTTSFSSYNWWGSIVGNDGSFAPAPWFNYGRTNTIGGIWYWMREGQAAVFSVGSAVGGGVFGAGSTLSLVITFTHSVNVTGSPILLLQTSATTTGSARYLSGSGSTALTFTYTVTATDSTRLLDYVSTFALSLPSGTRINDVDTGDIAVLTLPVPGSQGSLSEAGIRLGCSAIYDTTSSVTCSRNNLLGLDSVTCSVVARYKGKASSICSVSLASPTTTSPVLRITALPVSTNTPSTITYNISTTSSIFATQVVTLTFPYNSVSLLLQGVVDGTSFVTCNTTTLAITDYPATCTINARFNTNPVSLPDVTFYQLYTPSSNIGTVIRTSGSTFLFQPPTTCGLAILQDGVSTVPFYLDILSAPGAAVQLQALVGVSPLTNTSWPLVFRAASSGRAQLLSLASLSISTSSIASPGVSALGTFSFTYTNQNLYTLTWLPSISSPAGVYNMTIMVGGVARWWVYLHAYNLPDATSSVSCPAAAVVGTAIQCTLTPRQSGVPISTVSSVYTVRVLTGAGFGSVTSMVPVIGLASSFVVTIQLGSASGYASVSDGVSASAASVSVLALGYDDVGVACG